MHSRIDEVLKQLGWADGFYIPLANEENKTLEKQVEENFREKAEKKICLEELHHRLKALISRDKNLLEEQKHLKELFTEYQTQCEIESTLSHSLGIDRTSVLSEIRDSEKKIRELRESLSILDIEKSQLQNKLKDLNASIEWGEGALAAWKEDFSKTGEDKNLLEKYKLEDDSTFCEIEVKRQKLLAEVYSNQETLNHLVSKLKIADSELGHVSKTFRHVHEERNKILEQWGTAVNIFQARDESIIRVLMEISSLKNSGREKYKQLLEECLFYEEQFNDNNELQASIDEKSRHCEYLREEHQRSKLTLDEILNQVVASRRMLMELQHKLSLELNCLEKSLKDYENKENEEKSLNTAIENLKNKYTVIQNESLSSNERCRVPQKLFNEKTKYLDHLFREQKKYHDLLYRILAELNRTKKSSDLCFQEIQIFESHAEALEKKLKSAMKEIVNQEETLYNLNYHLILVNSDITFEEGKRNSEYLASLRKQIDELEIDLKEKTRDFDFIQAQVSQSDEESKRLKTEFMKDEPEVLKLKNSISDKLILIENGLRQIRCAENEVNDKQVEENLLKLRVDHLENLVSKKGSCLYSLEKQRIDLQMAMQERLLEIKTTKNLLQMQKRTLQEDKSDLKKSFEHLTIRIAQMKKRFEITRDMLGDFRENDQLTVTHLKIKIAQEKYELQEEGDDLDAKIHKAEQEISAMENTLKVINASNHLYKQNMSSVDLDSPEFKKKLSLEAQYYSLVQTVKAKQAKVKTINEGIQAIEVSLIELEASEEELKKKFQEKDRDAQDLDRHLDSQEKKLQRADRILKKAMREVHLLVERAPSIDFSERDIKLRELQELNQSSLQQLAELITRYIETGPTVNRYLEEKNLVLPSIYSSRFSVSSRVGSKAASSLSSFTPSRNPSILSVDGSALNPDCIPSSRSMPSIVVQNVDPAPKSKEFKMDKDPEEQGPVEDIQPPEELIVKILRFSRKTRPYSLMPNLSKPRKRTNHPLKPRKNQKPRLKKKKNPSGKITKPKKRRLNIKRKNVSTRLQAAIRLPLTHTASNTGTSPKNELNIINSSTSSVNLSSPAAEKRPAIVRLDHHIGPNAEPKGRLTNIFSDPVNLKYNQTLINNNNEQISASSVTTSDFFLDSNTEEFSPIDSRVEDDQSEREIKNFSYCSSGEIKVGQSAQLNPDSKSSKNNLDSMANDLTCSSPSVNTHPFEFYPVDCDEACY